MPTTPSEYFETYLYTSEPIMYSTSPLLVEQFNNGIQNDVNDSYIGGANIDYLSELSSSSISFSEVVSELGSNVATLSMTEPYIYFIAVAVVLAVVKIIRQIIT